MLFSTHNRAKHSFQERVILHNWVCCKTQFSARNGENLAKRSYEPTMEQDTVLKKDLYSMSVFDAKRIFKGQMVKIWKNAVFILK